MGEKLVCVIRSRTRILKNILGKASDSRGAMTSDPPTTGSGKSVPYDPTKWNGDTHSPREAALMPSCSAMTVTAAVSARWPVRTPFGVPLVPEV